MKPRPVGIRLSPVGAVALRCESFCTPMTWVRPVFALEYWSAIAVDAPKNKADQPQALLNVGTGAELTIRALAEQIAAVVGFKGDLLWDTSKPAGTPKKQLDLSRLRAMGWSASIPLADGLQRAYADFRTALGTEQLRS